jgi:hypothetical protein
MEAPMRRGAGAALLIITVVALGASTASATFPGGNGKIAFHAGLVYKRGRTSPSSSRTAAPRTHTGALGLSPG